MNLLKMTLSDQGAVLVGMTFGLIAEQKALLKDVGDAKLTLGIQPELVQLSTMQKEDSQACTIQHTEYLGTYKMVTVLLAEYRIKIMLDEEQQIPSHNAYLNFANQWLNFHADDYLIYFSEGASNE